MNANHYAQQFYSYLSGLNSFHWAIVAVAAVCFGIVCMKGEGIKR
ncbi:MAG: hypothetical protein AAF664_06960 [Planctomycetota bacterium]